MRVYMRLSFVDAKTHREVVSVPIRDGYTLDIDDEGDLAFGNNPMCDREGAVEALKMRVRQYVLSISQLGAAFDRLWEEYRKRGEYGGIPGQARCKTGDNR